MRDVLVGIVSLFAFLMVTLAVETVGMMRRRRRCHGEGMVLCNGCLGTGRVENPRYPGIDPETGAQSPEYSSCEVCKGKGCMPRRPQARETRAA
jgi:hypothetical protein